MVGSITASATVILLLLSLSLSLSVYTLEHMSVIPSSPVAVWVLQNKSEKMEDESRDALCSPSLTRSRTHTHTHTHTRTYTHIHMLARPHGRCLRLIRLHRWFWRHFSRVWRPFFVTVSLYPFSKADLSLAAHTHTHTHTRTHTHAHAHAHAHTHTGALVGHLELRFLFSLVSQRASTFLCPPSLFSLSPAAASLIPLLYFSHALVVLPTVTAGKTCVREREESNVCYRKRWNVGEAFSPSLSLSLSSYRSALTRSRL